MSPGLTPFWVDFGLLEANQASVTVAGYYPDVVYRYPGLPTTGTGHTTYLDLMTVRSGADAQQRREAIWSRLFTSGGPEDAGGADRGPIAFNDHDEYEFDLPYLHTSRAWLYRAPSPSGKLLIVHGGHANQGPEHPALFDIRVDALAAGHDVLVLSMPGQGPNVTPGPQGDYQGKNGLLAAGHGNIRWLDTHYLAQTNSGALFGVPPVSGLHVHWAPVFRAINEIGSQYSSIAITGHSGGAFCAGWCAALDTRIGAAYPTAGFMPRIACYPYLVDFGDAERNLRTHLEIANVLEGHVMAAEGRRVIYTLNRWDDCCYRGDTTRLESFVEQTKEEAARLGGRWDFVIDDSTEHGWSDANRDRILADMEDA